MPTVHLNDKRFQYAATDVLRLFFGKVAIRAEGFVLQTAGEEANWYCSQNEVGEWQIEPEPDCSTVPALPILTEEELRRERRSLKKALYFFCAEQTGQSFPWGSLTGIRPTYVVGEVIRKVGLENTEQVLHDDFGVSTEKSKLAVATYLEEERLLTKFSEHMCAVYVGIPFCPSRCYYCSFTLKEGIAATEELKERYVDRLVYEIAQTGTWFRQPVRSVYIGGGTPTELSAEQLERIYSALSEYLPLADNCELSLEAGRPDTIDRAKLEVSLRHGYDRICINPQTMHDETLRRIGRRHSTEQTLAAFALAEELGFRDINMDLIAGLPGETLAEFTQTLEQILALKPTSVTVHALAVKRSSNLNEDLVDSQRSLADLKQPNAEVAAMLSLAEYKLAEQGLQPYYLYRQKDGLGGLENVGFAAPGTGNLYNIAMMGDRRDVLGFGCGSISKRKFPGGRIERSPEVKSVLTWLNRVDEMVERKRRLFLYPEQSK